MRKLNKKAVAGVTAGLMLVGGGAAYAYWTSTGGGTGTGATSAGATNVFTVTQTSTISNMRPGDVAQSIAFDVQNTADHTLKLQTVTVAIDSVEQAVDAIGACAASDYTLSDEVVAPQEELTAGQTKSYSGPTLKFNNKASNQDGCKGAIVHLTYTAA